MALLPLHNPGAPIDLELGELKLTAFSISGVSTYVQAASLDACFDLGHCSVEAARLSNVFLSHVHQDHSLGAYRHLSLRRMFGMRDPRIVCPAESAEALREMFRACLRLEAQAQDPTVDGVVVGVKPGDEVPLGRTRRVRIFDVNHRIASVGFTVIERRQKLRDEWRGRNGAEIQQARLRGEVVADDAEHLILTYIGDSTIETLRRHPEVGESEVLFLEATHVGDTSAETSEKWGHTHLDQIAALYRERPAVLASRHIVLKHFSTRYDRAQIVRAAGALPEELRARVTLLI